ncbi:MerR family transcriptional regulator [Nocardia sp. NPDC001965]
MKSIAESERRPDRPATDHLTIGELATRFDLATHVLRHWESVGLLLPAERVNGRRKYNQDHVLRVAMIVRGKAAGLSLEQLREWLDAPSRAARRRILADQHAKLADHIAAALASQQMIEHAMDCEAETLTQCPAFRRLVEDLIDAQPITTAPGS